MGAERMDHNKCSERFCDREQPATFVPTLRSMNGMSRRLRECTSSMNAVEAQGMFEGSNYVQNAKTLLHGRDGLIVVSGGQTPYMLAGSATPIS